MSARHEFRGGTGEPLVLIHGGTSSWQCWRGVLPLVTPHFDVLAANLPGHGGLPVTKSLIEIGDLADAVEARMDAAGFATAHIAGNSLGGWLAIELIRRGRARSVVAFSPAGGWYPGETRVRNRFYKMRRAAVATRPVLPIALLSPAVRRYALRGACEHGERLTPRQAVAAVTTTLQCDLRVFEGLAPGAGPELPADLAVPTLIAWSERDRIVPAAYYTQRWREVAPNASWRTLPGVGHVPMYDDPALVARTIKDWTRS